MPFQIAQQIDPSIFRAYDIRGIVDKNLTNDVVYTIGLAIGSQAREQGENKFVVARDGRLSGVAFIESLKAGLLATGCDVIDIGMVPTPVLYFATYTLPNVRSGVMITGSHNPPDYNGLKIMIGGETLFDQHITQLYERIQQQNFAKGQGVAAEMDIIPDYLQRITSDVRVKKPLKVVIDCGNGVTGKVAPTLMRELGCQVTELFTEVDGKFPNHHPDPSVAENLTDLIHAVKQNKADIGLAFDGDGDRLGVVTNAGEIIWPDRQLMLYAIDVLTRKPGAQIIYDVKCTQHLEKIIRENGGEPLMWKTGHSFMKSKLNETGAPLAGEMSGHIFFKERWYGFDDGLYTAARLLEIISSDARSVDEIFKALPDSVNTPELKLNIAEEVKFSFVERLQKELKFDAAKITTIDGLRADFADGWGLIRASNTTPCLVLRFEAVDEKSLQRIQNLFREQLLQMDPALVLPF